MLRLRVALIAFLVGTFVLQSQMLAASNTDTLIWNEEMESSYSSVFEELFEQRCPSLSHCLKRADFPMRDSFLKVIASQFSDGQELVKRIIGQKHDSSRAFWAEKRMEFLWSTESIRLAYFVRFVTAFHFEQSIVFNTKVAPLNHMSSNSWRHFARINDGENLPLVAEVILYTQWRHMLMFFPVETIKGVDSSVMRNSYSVAARNYPHQVADRQLLSGPVLSDFYSPRIDAFSITPGSLFYDPKGEAAIVAKIDSRGAHFLLGSLAQWRFYDGKSLRYKNKDFLKGREHVTAELENGGGFKKFRPYRKNTGKLEYLSNAEIPDFSLEQYDFCFDVIHSKVQDEIFYNKRQKSTSPCSVVEIFSNRLSPARARVIRR